MHVVVRRPGRQVQPSEEARVVRAVSRLFVELTLGTRQCVFAGNVQQPGGNLEQLLPDGDAELPDEDDVAVRGERNDRGSRVLAEHLPLPFPGPRLRDDREVAAREQHASVRWLGHAPDPDSAGDGDPVAGPDALTPALRGRADELTEQRMRPGRS